MLEFLKRLFCRHEYVYTTEYWTYFSSEHITKVCVKCGKKVY